jgi:L-aspartate oxidase
VRPADTVVVGSGIAGLATALALAPRPVTVLTRTVEGGSSWLAQGGVACALGGDDSPRLHAEDTVAVGAGLTDPALAALLTAEGVERIRGLIAAGMRFDAGADGAPALGREAGHRRRRILHAGGDGTGRALVRTLLALVRQAPSITLVEGALAWDLLVEDGRVRGVLAHDRAGGWTVHRAPRVVLATGGIGQAFLYTTNPPEATGDGLAMAGRAGAALADLEFVQFHPTALDVPQAAAGAPVPLLSEALRGEGAVLRDARGRRFMAGEHPDAELAPRDVVARAVWRRRAAGEPVYLDATEAPGERFPARFPTVFAHCRAAGLDPRVDPVPVAPAAHYHMGGILVDDRGRSTLDGLWACGEAASTGVHGGNRLASNSLLEGLVFGHRVAADVAAYAAPAGPAPVPPLVVQPGPPEVAAAARLAGLRRTLYDHVGLVRDGDGLGRAVAALGALHDELDGWARVPGGPVPVPAHDAAALAVLRNLCLVGHTVALAAQARTESRGAHWRRDFPLTDPAWQRRQVLHAPQAAGQRTAATPAAALAPATA